MFIRTCEILRTRGQAGRRQEAINGAAMLQGTVEPFLKLRRLEPGACPDKKDFFSCISFRMTEGEGVSKMFCGKKTPTARLTFCTQICK